MKISSGKKKTKRVTGQYSLRYLNLWNLIGTIFVLSRDPKFQEWMAKAGLKSDVWQFEFLHGQISFGPNNRNDCESEILPKKIHSRSKSNRSHFLNMLTLHRARIMCMRIVQSNCIIFERIEKIFWKLHNLENQPWRNITKNYYITRNLCAVKKMYTGNDRQRP